MRAFPHVMPSLEFRTCSVRIKVRRISARIYNRDVAKKDYLANPPIKGLLFSVGTWQSLADTPLL